MSRQLRGETDDVRNHPEWLSSDNHIASRDQPSEEHRQDLDGFLPGEACVSAETRKPKLLLALSELTTLISSGEEHLHLGFAQAAEEAGFDGIFVSEHLVMGPNSASKGLERNPRAFVEPDKQDPRMPWPSPLVKLAAIAGATKSIRVMSLALIAPLRHPISVAKEIATLDLMSQGRLTVLPTVSWQQDEYRAMGIPFRERGKRLDEHLAIWHQLWSETTASFDGQFYQYEDVYFEPKPHEDRPEIWFGGGQLDERLINRIVKYGNGFMPGFFPTRDDWRPLAEAMENAGRDFGDLELTTWLVPEFPDLHSPADFEKTLDERISGILDVGYSHIAVKPSCFIDSAEEMGDFCEKAVKQLDSYF